MQAVAALCRNDFVQHDYIDGSRKLPAGHKLPYNFHIKNKGPVGEQLWQHSRVFRFYVDSTYPMLPTNLELFLNPLTSM